MPPSSLLGWLSYIESQHPSNIELGLDRCTKVLNKLNYDRPKKKIFTVAGTNGKGSTCAFLTQYFVDANYSVGTFTSPHFIDFNERIAINNQPVSDQVICDAFEKVEAVRGNIPLTYFEFNTLAAIWIFSEAKLDYWVLEIGLGGRLDSVNMIDCDVAIVTSIALDHTDWLGSSIEGIAREKAGIARKGKLFINGVQKPPRSLVETALAHGAIVKEKNIDFGFELDATHQTWRWWNDKVVYENLPLPSLPIENAATVIASLIYSDHELDEAALFHLMKQTQLLGRFQYIHKDPDVIIDVAHNPEAATELAKQIDRLDKPVVALCGMLHDKDIKSVIEVLSAKISEWNLVDLGGPRGAKAKEIAQYLKDANLFSNVEQGLDTTLGQVRKENKVLIVFGSFVTVSECLIYFKEKRISYA